MFKIKKVIWISTEALEAEVTITDGQFELICFSQPFEFKEGEEINGSIFGFNVKNIVRSFENIYKIEKLPSVFSYNITGRLIDKSEEIVEVGNIKIQLDYPLPKDIAQGEFVSFECGRLDLY